MKLVFSLLISLLVLSTALGHDISGESHSGEFVVSNTYHELRIVYLTLKWIDKDRFDRGDKTNIWEESTSSSYYSTEAEAETASEEYSIGGGIVNVGDKSITGITVMHHIHYRSSIPASDDPHSHIHLEKGTENPVSAEKHSHPYTDAHHTHGEEHDTITHPGDLVPLTIDALKERGIVVSLGGEEPETNSNRVVHSTRDGDNRVSDNRVSDNRVDDNRVDDNRVTPPVAVNTPAVDTPAVDTPAVNTPVTNAKNVVRKGAITVAATPGVVAIAEIPVTPGALSPVAPIAPVVRTFVSDLFVTEYMIADWSVWIPVLATWIELYNPNTVPVNLQDYVFEYAVWNNVSKEHEKISITLTEFSVPAQTAIILTNKIVTFPSSIGGIDPETQVYNLDIPNRVLKKGWILKDPDEKIIDQRGIFFEAVGNPYKPPHVNKARSSFKTYLSVEPEERYHYGNFNDIGDPGYYEAVPAAPSIRIKQVGLWGSLKQE